MTTMDWFLVLIIGPPVWFLFGVWGRKEQRRMWQMDKPYEQRIRK